MPKHSAMRAVAAFAALVVCGAVSAQSGPPSRNADAVPQSTTPESNRAVSHADPQTAKPVANQPAKPSALATPAPASLLSQPAQPASVTLQHGKLTIDAHNSTLSEILHQIARAGGMKISGLQTGKPDQRIFGTYGPGTPRAVLSDLLNGSGYNVLMLGTTPSGVPGNLALSVRPPGGVPNPPPQSAANLREEYEENQIRPTQYPPTPQYHPEHPGPSRQRGIRTPEQILQELEQMRQHTQQNQQQNQQ